MSQRSFNFRWALVLPFLLFLTAFGFTQAPPQATTLQAGDVLEVTVVNSKDYSGEVIVLDDGSITGKGFDHLMVSGKTLAQAKAMVVNALKLIFKDPAVSVVLTKPRGQFVYVVGLAGGEPGPRPWYPGETIQQLFGDLGFTALPSRYDVSLTHSDGSSETLDLESIINATGPTAKIVLKPNDVLMVLAKARERVWVDGVVTRPGETFIDKGMDLYQAIDQAGGIRSDAFVPSPTYFGMQELSIHVQRGEESFDFPARKNPKAAKFEVEPNDVISVQTPHMARIDVGGYVNVPGEFVVRSGASIQSAIVQAKGVSPEGTSQSVVVFRGKRAFKVDASAPQTDHPASQFGLQDGDVVFINRNQRDVFALGDVSAPGRFAIPDGATWHVTDLLALAKGIGLKGSYRRVILLHPDSTGEFKMSRFNLDEFLKDGKTSSNPILQAGDVVFFGEPKGISFADVAQVVSTAYLFRLVTGK